MRDRLQSIPAGRVPPLLLARIDGDHQRAGRLGFNVGA
jgi:hypothetical protein